MSREDLQCKESRVFQVNQLLSPTECQHYIDLTNKMGYSSIAWEYQKNYRYVYLIITQLLQLSNFFIGIVKGL